MKIRKFGCLSKDEISELEKRFDLVLPEDYKKFLMENNGGVVEKDSSNRIYVKSLNDYIVLDVLYGYHVLEKNADIVCWMDEMPDDILEKTIIIGDDIRQGFIVMICEGEDKGIYYWDDAYNFEQSDDEENIYFLSDSFEKLIMKKI